MSTIALTHDDIDGAVSEIARLSGAPLEAVWAAVREQAGGERDIDSLARGVTEVALAVQEQGGAYGDEGTAWDPASPDYIGLTDYSADERQHLASIDHALPDGSYPIQTEEDAQHAATLAKSHHGDWKAAMRLIAKRCREEGWDNPLDSDEDDVAASMADAHVRNFSPEAYRQREQSGAGAPVRAGNLVIFRDANGQLRYRARGEPVALTDTGDDGASVTLSHEDAVLLEMNARNPRTLQYIRPRPEFGYLVGLSAGEPGDGYSPDDWDLPGEGGYPGMGDEDDIAARHPGILGGRHTGHGGGRGHTRSCDPECSRDHLQPRGGNVTHPEVARLIEANPHLFSDGQGREGANSGNISHRPKSAAQREREERRSQTTRRGSRTVAGMPGAFRP